MYQFERTQKLLGKAAVKKLKNSAVAVFGLGGVGSFVVEALARAGVGKLVLVDFDTVEKTNLNRQLFALHSTIGMKKTDVAKARVLDINPDAVVDAVFCRFDEQTVSQFDFSSYSYVVDAIDSVSSKVLLAVSCQNSGTPLISCMGTGNKTDPTRFEVTDIYKTAVCPLAKVMRKRLKEAGVISLKVVYSTEQPKNAEETNCEKPVVASCSFVPPVAGMILVSEVVKDLVAK